MPRPVIYVAFMTRPHYELIMSRSLLVTLKSSTRTLTRMASQVSSKARAPAYITAHTHDVASNTITTTHGGHIPLSMEQNNSALTLLSHLSAYSLAGCLMEHFVVFHSWQLTTSPDELQRLQTPTGMRTLYIYVIPKMITTLLACYLAWTTNQTWLKWCVACLTVSWVSSFTVQIPLQRRIQQTGDSKALVTLVWTDWVRVGSMLGHCGIVFWGCHSLG